MQKTARKKHLWLKIIATATIVAVLIFAITGFFADVENAKKYAKLGGDNPALFLAIAKAESGFNQLAVSKKGAVGLCQIMPKTAEWCAEQMGISYDENMLYNAEYNGKIANFYLEYLREKFQSETCVICAYNAGEGNVSKWLANPKITNKGNLENIPFKETNDYLIKVEKYKRKFEIYAKLGII